MIDHQASFLFGAMLCDRGTYEPAGEVVTGSF